MHVFRYFKKALVCSFVLLFNAAFAQQNRVTFPADQSVVLDVKPISGKSINDGVIQPQTVEEPFMVKVLHQSPRPEYIDEEKMMEIVAEKNKLKANNPPSNDRPRAMASVTPSVGRSFDANGLYGTIPPDNTMAISKGGIIVTADNSSVTYFDADGFVLGEYWYSDNFLTQYSGMKFDPRLTYDPINDKFIFVILAGGLTVGNSVILMTSKTNDPRDGWNYHQLSGNPENAGTMADFPQVGFSDNDIFIGGSWFNGSFSYQGSFMYQVKKSEAYSSGSVNYELWKDFDAYGFNLVPCTFGIEGQYGQSGIFFISNWAMGASQISLYEITDDLGGNPQMKYSQVFTSSYSPAGDVPQIGGSLVAGDSRMQAAFYLDGVVHYVFHKDMNNGNSGVVYGRVDVSTLSHQSVDIKSPGKEACYPNLGSLANVESDKTVGVGYLVSSSSMYAGSEVVVVDDEMEISDPVTVGTGDATVSYGGGAQRWGDYTGMCPRYGANTPTLWFCGSRASETFFGARLYKGVLVEFTASGNTVDIETPIEESQPKGAVYPNPVIDAFTMQMNLEQREHITMQIFDAQGKMVKELFTGEIGKGPTEILFNKGALPAGIYTVKAFGNLSYQYAKQLVIAE